MKYNVIWQPLAQNQLAEIWNQSPDRASVTAAADELDRQLMHQPLEIGESRPGNKRIVFVHPLAAYVRVDETERTVRVGCIWRY
jgi:plasmid stabilization system protein ParE